MALNKNRMYHLWKHAEMDIDEDEQEANDFPYSHPYEDYWEGYEVQDWDYDDEDHEYWVGNLSPVELAQLKCRGINIGDVVKRIHGFQSPD
jgi:hypothetical protein